MRFRHALAIPSLIAVFACTPLLPATPTATRAPALPTLVGQVSAQAAPPTITAISFPTRPADTPTATTRPTQPPTLAATATLRPTATPTPTATPCDTLRQCADRKQIDIGTYFNAQWLAEPSWRQIVSREFNLAVVSAGFYWDDLEAERGRFDFSFVDEQVALARSLNMKVCGHALLLAQPPYIPEWLAEGTFTREELAQILRDYITTVMTRYRGQVSEYIVVEDAPLAVEQERDAFYRQFGYEYIDLAFQIAREVDPSAVLIYNADQNETTHAPATQLTLEIIQRLKAKRLVDGVGLEMHLDGSKEYDKQEVIATMKSYGLPVYVTEIDVGLKDVAGAPAERYARQAKIYGDMLAACQESGVCKSFAVWGIGDKYSWLERQSANSDPTLFDDELNPKPAFQALIQTLRNE